AQFGAVGFRGNVGGRYVQTDLTAQGYTFSAGVPVLATAENDYNEFLPSLNVVVEPTDGLLLRFAASRVMSRPNLGFLAPGSSVSVSGNNRTVNAGNPTLDPTIANAYDASVE